MAAHLARIEQLNPQLNAIVAKLDDDACLQAADDADAAVARGDEVGPLHGLPTAFKDTEPAVGFPYTMGSTIFRSFRPTEDSVLVERLRRAGVVPIGKTNVPEFGMGSHTYNSVYGTTRNPYDLSMSAGGSSGGAAAALAAGLLPIADGSDYGGSLAQPGQLQQRRGAAADGRAGARRADDAPARRLRGEGHARPLGGRRRAGAERGGRHRRPRPVVVPERSGVVRGALGS